MTRAGPDHATGATRCPGFPSQRCFAGSARPGLFAGLGALALLILPPTPALAGGWQSGAQIEQACAAEPETNPVAVTFCLGYLQGALDAFLLGRANCIPGTVDANGLRAALLEHVRGHPEAVSAASGPMLVYDAFRVTWPSCAQMPALDR